jgi:MFS family permease
MLWSPITSNWLLKKYNGKLTMAVGMGLMGVIIALFGLIDGVVTQVTAVFVYSTLLRILQGVASATMATSCYAVGIWEHPEKTMFLIAGMEVVTGLGIILGPVIGTPLYSHFGFMWCFFLVGAFMLILSIVFYLCAPDFKPFEKEGEKKDQLLADSPQSDLTEKDIGICSLFKIGRFSMAALAATLCYF